MQVVEIPDINDARVAPFARLTEAQLRNRLDASAALIIVESPKVIAMALRHGLQPVSLLCERKHITGDAAEIIAQCPEDMPVYTAPRDVLAKLTGYTLTRGVLCAMRRPSEPTAAQILENAGRVCIIDGVCDTTNIGAIFRNAAALGMDALLLTRTSCDPYNRRAARVSMGTVFAMPWAWIDSPAEVRDYGFKTIAMALRHDSVMLNDPKLKAEPKLAIIMGTEGDGLSEREITDADYVVKIPMHRGVDSLNVASASAIAFYQLCQKN